MRTIVSFLCFALFISACVGQSPQPGPFTITSLNPSVTTSGTLTPTTPAANYHLSLYSIWVPENTGNITFTIANTNTDTCEYITAYVRSDAPPCSEDDYEDLIDGVTYMCDLGAETDDIYDSYTYTVLPNSDGDGLFYFEVNKTLYFGIGRYFSTDYSETCTYSIRVDLPAVANNTVALPEVDNDDNYYLISQPYTVVTSPNNITFNGTAITYKLVLPLDVASVHIDVITTDDDLYIFASNYYGPNDRAYEYEEDDWDTTDGTNYFYSADFYAPRAGAFFVTITADDDDDDSDAEFAAGVISIRVNQCPAGWGGWNCKFPSTPLNLTTLAAGAYNFTIPYNETADEDGNDFHTWVYLYYDIVANYAGNDIVVFANTPNDDYYSYVLVRRDGYPMDTPFGVETGGEVNDIPGGFAINQFDFTVPGRIYFGFECYTEPSCIVNVGTKYLPGTTTGAAATTATTATSATTARATTTTTTTSRATTTGTSGTPPITTTTTGTVPPTTSTTATVRPTTTTSTTATIKPPTTTNALPISTTTNGASSLSLSYFVAAAFILAAVAVF